jgi:tetratricopeptide (TPR) repeat protein
MPSPTLSISSPSDVVHGLLPKGVSYYGPLDLLTHEEFVELIERHQGRYVRYAHRAEFLLLVLGEGDLPVAPNGEPIDFHGRAVICESEFLRALGEHPHAEPAADRSFTAPALADLLKVPEARVMAWAKAGLLRPRAVEHGVFRFDFRQAAVARTLVQLTQAGVTPAKLRRSIERLGKWLPDLDEPLQQLSLLERNGPLLVRLESGELAEVDGQMRLDFEAEDAPPPAPVRLSAFAPKPRTSTDWHELAVIQERSGLLAEAVASYRQALQVAGPQPQICFDLAHALAELGRFDQAAERYRQVTELDPQRADAWNNLGIVLTETGDSTGAIHAFHEALRRDPDDSQVHYNLADLLDEAGEAAEAAKHFRAFLRLSPADSPWAQHARDRCRALNMSPMH